MIDLTLTLADTSTTTVEAYQASPRSVPHAVTPAATRGTIKVIRTRGDHQPQVTSLDFSIELPAATLALAYDAAYVLIAAAEQTVNVAWHEGDVDIAALITSSMTPVGPATIRVDLSWLPAAAAVTRRAPAVPM